MGWQPGLLQLSTHVRASSTVSTPSPSASRGSPGKTGVLRDIMMDVMSVMSTCRSSFASQSTAGNNPATVERLAMPTKVTRSPLGSTVPVAGFPLTSGTGTIDTDEIDVSFPPITLVGENAVTGAFLSFGPTTGPFDEFVTCVDPM